MSIFFEEGAKNEEKPVEKGKTKATATTPTNAVQTPPSIVSTIGGGVVDNKFVEMLNQVIVQNNIPGLDYFEFKQAIDAMGNLAVTEAAKFQTAYSIYAVQGCDKNVLLTSLDKYVALIQTEQKSFDAELAKQQKVKVQDKFDAVEDAKKELEKLNAKIIELNGYVLKTSQEIQQEQSNLDNIAANFKKSADVVLNNLLSDKEKINSLIK